MESSRLILSRMPAAYLAMAIALAVAAASRRARARPPRCRRHAPGAAAAAGLDACRHPHRHAAERPDLLHPPQRRGPSNRRHAAPGGQGRLDRRGRRSARPGARARAHGVQRHRALQAGRAGVLPRVDRRRGSARTSTPTRASTRRSTCSTCRPTAPASLARGFEALSDFAGGITLDTAGDRPRARRRASRNGAAAWAPARACRSRR